MTTKLNDELLRFRRLRQQLLDDHPYFGKAATERQPIAETGPSDRPPSGRAVREPKLRVDECHQFDLSDLSKAGVFQRGNSPVWIVSAIVPKLQAFTSCSVQLVICVIRDDSGAVQGLTLLYEHPQTGETVTHPVLITSTPCHPRGHRLWFQCSAVVDQRVCQRRCRILYLPPGATYFVCRECRRLTYEKRQRHRDRGFNLSRAHESIQQELRNPIPLVLHPYWEIRLRTRGRVEVAIQAIPPREESSQKSPQTHHSKRTRRDRSPDGLTHHKGQLEHE